MIPDGYVLENELIFGKSKSHPGLFEIKIHNPKKRNAATTDLEIKLTKLIK